MTKPRSHYVDYKQPRYYHITSRCVRRAWLLGKDPQTGRNNNHRKQVFLNRLQHLAQHFSVQIMGYAIMSNHFHLVVRYDPIESQHWEEEEVARRWCAAFNGQPFTQSHLAADSLSEFNFDQTLRYHELLVDDKQLQRCRASLGSLSRFMQHLKQPFAVWANHEDQCSGHFFEMRFYSGVLLDRSDLLSCMAYVDLNPVEAQMLRTLGESEHTSIHERLRSHRFDATELDAYLAPMWMEEDESGLELPISIKDYTEQLNLMVAYKQRPSNELLDKMESWMARLVNRERGKKKTPHAFFDYF